MRRAVVLVVLVCCGGQKTVPPVVGLTQATAIAVPLTFDAKRLVPALASSLDPTVSWRGSRWFVVTLPPNGKRTLSVSVEYDGAARSVEIDLIDPTGRVVAPSSAGTHGQYTGSGWRSAWLDEAQGTYFIRVTTHDGSERYGVRITSTEVTPRPKEWAPCNAYVYDAENPRCKGVVACDPNKPVTTNPACCSKRCIRGWCSGTLSRITAEDGYAWFSLGAKAGITTWHNGYSELTLIKGTRVKVHIKVVEVELERSKVVLSIYDVLDRSLLDGRLALLQTPAVCGED